MHSINGFAWTLLQPTMLQKHWDIYSYISFILCPGYGWLTCKVDLPARTDRRATIERSIKKLVQINESLTGEVHIIRENPVFSWSSWVLMVTVVNTTASFFCEGRRESWWLCFQDECSSNGNRIRMNLLKCFQFRVPYASDVQAMFPWTWRLKLRLRKQ